MRLIDANALKERIEKYRTVHLSHRRLSAIRREAEEVINDIRFAIDAAPTIDPVKRGKWGKTYLDHEAIGERPCIFYCSVCNQCIAYPVNYCPSCGADMRGKEDENNNQI